MARYMLIFALVVLSGCAPAGVQEEPPQADAGTCCASPNVTITLVNTTSEAQRFDPVVTVQHDANTPTDVWEPGIVTVPANSTRSFPGVLTAPHGSRLSVDSWLLTENPNIRSGRGFSMTVLSTAASCTIATTGLAPPNGLSVSC